MHLSRGLHDEHRNRLCKVLVPSPPSSTPTMTPFLNCPNRSNSPHSNSTRWSASPLRTGPPRKWLLSPKPRSSVPLVRRRTARCATTIPMDSMGTTSCDATWSGCTLRFAKCGFALTSRPTRASWPTARPVATASVTAPTITPPHISVALTSTPASAAGVDVGKTVRSAAARAVGTIHPWTFSNTGWNSGMSSSLRTPKTTSRRIV